MRTFLLVWQKDEGFYTRIILRDPNSDAETTKPLNFADFPTGILLEALTIGAENVPQSLTKPLIEILEKTRVE